MASRGKAASSIHPPPFCRQTDTCRVCTLDLLPRLVGGAWGAGIEEEGRPEEWSRVERGTIVEDVVVICKVWMERCVYACVSSTAGGGGNGSGTYTHTNCDLPPPSPSTSTHPSTLACGRRLHTRQHRRQGAIRFGLGVLRGQESETPVSCVFFKNGVVFWLIEWVV